MENIGVYLSVLAIPLICYILIYVIFSSYKKIIIKGNSGFEVARRILDDNNLDKMYIVEVRGILDDHYDMSQKVIRLSSSVFHGESVSAVSVSSFISSYALLDDDTNTFMKIKKMLDPIINFMTIVSYVLFLVSILGFGEIFALSMVFMIFVLIYHLAMIPLSLKLKETALAELGKNDEYIKYKSNINTILSVYIVADVASIIFDVVNYIIKLIKGARK